MEVSLCRTPDGLSKVMSETPSLKYVWEDIDDWVKNPLNLVYTDGEDNFGCFQYELPNVYTGHYFFGNARGRKALKLSKEIIDKVFSIHEAELIRGMTPLGHLGARWMNKQLGFKSYGVVQTAAGPCELVILTKKEWASNG